MKKTWYKWTFADGSVYYCAGFDRTEKENMERKHGKILSKEKI